MKKVTSNAVNAFNQEVNFAQSNTTVRTDNGMTKLFLFGNLIAEKSNGKLFITNDGWQSNTTKERLNALNGVSIQQNNFKWYLNGTIWDGSWIEIK